MQQLGSPARCTRGRGRPAAPGTAHGPPADAQLAGCRPPSCLWPQACLLPRLHHPDKGGTGLPGTSPVWQRPGGAAAVGAAPKHIQGRLRRLRQAWAVATHGHHTRLGQLAGMQTALASPDDRRSPPTASGSSRLCGRLPSARLTGSDCWGGFCGAPALGWLSQGRVLRDGGLHAVDGQPVGCDAHLHWGLGQGPVHLLHAPGQHAVALERCCFDRSAPGPVRLARLQACR